MSTTNHAPSQAPGKRVKVRLVEETWYVDHTGSDLEFGVLQLFGTALLKTPFTVGVATDDLVWWLQENSNGDYEFEVVA